MEDSAPLAEASVSISRQAASYHDVSCGVLWTIAFFFVFGFASNLKAGLPNVFVDQVVCSCPACAIAFGV